MPAIYTAYRTWIAEETVDQDHLNEQVRDNGLYLKARLDISGYAKAFAKLDLSEGAQADVVIAHFSVAAVITKAILLYTEESSGDAGVVVTIGKETDEDYYYTGTSEINKAKWYEKEVTLLQTAVVAGDTVICGTAGGKGGTGEILVCIEYYVDI